MSQYSHEHPEEFVQRPYRGYDPDEFGWKQDSRKHYDADTLALSADARNLQRSRFHGEDADEQALNAVEEAIHRERCELQRATGVVPLFTPEPKPRERSDAGGSGAPARNAPWRRGR